MAKYNICLFVIAMVATSCGIKGKLLIPEKGASDDQTLQSSDLKSVDSDWKTYLDHVDLIESNPEIRAIELPFECWPSTDIRSLVGNDGAVISQTEFCQQKGEVDYHFSRYAYLAAMGSEASFQRTSREWDLRNPANHEFQRLNFSFRDENNWSGVLICSSHQYQAHTSTESRKATYKLKFEVKNGKLLTSEVENLPYSDPQPMQNQKPELSVCTE